MTALRPPHVRGRWGEIQLRRVVEMAGMLEHCDFRRADRARDEDGGSWPDLIVRLPGGKKVVVDAKAPLEALPRRVDARPTRTSARANLHDHARHVREHMAKLGAEAYWSSSRRRRSS